MIWFFLTGMVAGAVGWHMFIMWLGQRIKRKQLDEAFKKGGKSHE